MCSCLAYDIQVVFPVIFLPVLSITIHAVNVGYIVLLSLALRDYVFDELSDITISNILAWRLLLSRNCNEECLQDGPGTVTILKSLLDIGG